MRCAIVAFGVLALGCGRSQPYDFSEDPPVLVGAPPPVVADRHDAGMVAPPPVPPDAGLIEILEDRAQCPRDEAPSVVPRFDGPGGGFQSNSGTGESSTIRVTFSCPVSWVAVTVFDPDFKWNRLRAEDAIGQVIAEVDFASDGTPGALTQDRKEVQATGIYAVQLVPARGDYVWWKDLAWK